jgi:hypothetical protein
MWMANRIRISTAIMLKNVSGSVVGTHEQERDGGVTRASRPGADVVHLVKNGTVDVTLPPRIKANPGCQKRPGRRVHRRLSGHSGRSAWSQAIDSAST